MATDSAVTRALGIPELREIILLQLPIKDLLLAQRISKTFLHTIQGSKLLQMTLFFQPAESCHIEYREHKTMDDVHLTNRYLMFQQARHQPERPVYRPPRAFHTIPLNGFFLPERLDIEKSSIRSRAIHPAVTAVWIRQKTTDHHDVDIRVAVAEQADPDELAAAVASTAASWRRMCVKHCLCNETTVTLVVFTQGGEFVKGGEVGFAAGARMGEMMDWCAGQFAHYKRQQVVAPLEEGEREG